MRALAITVLLLLAVFPSPPAGAAASSQHYGSWQRGCGPEGLVHVTVTSIGPTCTAAYHAGYLESADCEGATCSLRLWHQAFAYWHEAGRRASVESFLLVGLERIDLCSKTGATPDVYCAIDGEVVRFPLAEGCRRIDMRTIARGDDTPFASRADGSFLVCRHGEMALLGHPEAIYSVGTWRWGPCGPGIQSGCHIGVGADIAPQDCTADVCTIEFAAWGFARSNLPTARAIATSLQWSTGAVVGCAGADAGLVATCEEFGSFPLVIGVGQCEPFALTLDIVDPTSPYRLEVPFTLCRTHENDFDVRE